MKTRTAMTHRAISGRWLVVTAACIGATAIGCLPLEQEVKISACGGFGQQEQSLDVDPTGYCDAEMLHWRHDAATGKLTLRNTRVTLNCCGEHSMFVDQEGDTYLVTERDAPEQIGPLPGNTARCGCMCVYDFEIAIAEVAAGSVALRLVRDITDVESGPATAWEGEIDLGAGQGSIVVDAGESMWCETAGQ
ncbi:MAG: hypothetical protein JXR83_09430 [Deltaproteobacteria bacterium]|nr:hypothetical protein [Deltaproteobacteria bacterium]